MAVCEKSYIGTTVSKDEKEVIQSSAKVLRMTTAEYLRRCALEAGEKLSGREPAMTMDEQASLLNAQQATNYLNVSRETLDTLMRSGKLDYIRLSPGGIRFEKEALDRFIEESKIRKKEQEEEDEKERLLTPREVADYYHVAYGTVMRYINSGKLKHYMIGMQYRVRKCDAEEFLLNCGIV